MSFSEPEKKKKHKERTPIEIERDRVESYTLRTRYEGPPIRYPIVTMLLAQVQRVFIC